jgi:hypothetical protein
MAHAVAVQLGRLRAGVTSRARSNAWTRGTIAPGAARRLAGLRYWDGNCVS